VEKFAENLERRLKRMKESADRIGQEFFGSLWGAERGGVTDIHSEYAQYHSAYLAGEEVSGP